MPLPLSNLSMALLPNWFTGVLQGFAPLFSARVWPQVQLLVIGAILSPGKRTVTTALRVLGWPDPKAWTLPSRDSIQERAYTVVFPFSPGGRDDGRMCGVLPAHGDGRPATGLPGPLTRRPVAQRRMRPPSVVQRAPGLQNHLSMQHRVEHFQVQAFLPES
jgi:hypothetical protein